MVEKRSDGVAECCVLSVGRWALGVPIRGPKWPKEVSPGFTLGAVKNKTVRPEAKGA